MSCNDSTQILENKNYRLKYQPTKKTETLENSCVNEMGEASVPMGDHWKYCHESCKAVKQHLEEIQVQRTRNGLIKTLKSLGKTAHGKGHMLLGSQDICGVKETEREMVPKASDQGGGMDGVSHKELRHVGKKGVSPHFKAPL